MCELRTDAPTLPIDEVASPAVELPEELTSARHRLLRRRLLARGAHREDRDAEEQKAPHHARVESTNIASAVLSGGTTPVASLRGATVILDDRVVLRAVDLELMPGITVLRGPNGSGKTTALRALAGLLPLARGERTVPFDTLYLGHRPQLLHGLTAYENLHFFSAFRGPTSRAIAFSRDRSRAGGRDARVTAPLERWGQLGVADRPVERLSVGQRRRVALARLEIETCALVLLDEPFSELDDEGAAILRASLTLLTKMGCAILVASHGHHDLDEIATRVYTLRDGAAVTAA
jgi:heme exporter protein A